MRLITPLRATLLLMTGLSTTLITNAAHANEAVGRFHVFADHGRGISHGVDDWGSAFGLGWRHAKGFSVELQHVRSLFDLRVITTFGDQILVNQISADTTALMAGWTVPFGDTPWSATAQLGAHKPDFDLSLPATVGPSQDTQLAGALQLSYAANDHWQIGLNVSRYELKGSRELDRAAIRLDYRF